MEEDESTAAQEGTLAHAVAEGMIKAFQQSAEVVYPEGATDEMIDAAKVYAEDVINTMHETEVYGGGHCITEARLSMPQIHEAAFGTCDQFLFAPTKHLLYIWDFKYGFGHVSPKENWQLMAYYTGIASMLGINGYDDQRLTVVFRIAQPRAFGKPAIEEWRIKAADLRPYIVRMSNAAQKNLSAEAECKAGAHCKHCPAIHACSAALAVGVGLFEALSKPIPLDLSGDQLASMLDYVQYAHNHLGQLKEAIETQVKSTIQSGGNVPGYTLQKSYGRKSWTISPEEVLLIGESFGIDLSKPNVITPAQAVKAGIDEELVNQYADRSANGFKIVKAAKIADAFDKKD